MDTLQKITVEKAPSISLLNSIMENMIRIPSGTFMQGSSQLEVEECVFEWKHRLISQQYTEEVFCSWIKKEYPKHQVNVSAFYISKFLITNKIYSYFLQSTIGVSPPESIGLHSDIDHPVWGVCLENVYEFIEWLNQNDKVVFSLPSESEWEYAAKGNTEWKYPFGNVFNSNYCNTVEALINNTTPVGYYSSTPSVFGLFDMAGNVEEWTSSCYKPYPGGMEVKDELYRTLGGNYPILKGGSYCLGGDLSRCSRRHGPFIGDRFKVIGIRLSAKIK